MKTEPSDRSGGEEGMIGPFPMRPVRSVRDEGRCRRRDFQHPFQRGKKEKKKQVDMSASGRTKKDRGRS